MFTSFDPDKRANFEVKYYEDDTHLRKKVRDYPGGHQRAELVDPGIVAPGK